MRSYPSCWNKTLSKLGFRRKPRKKSKKHDYFRRRSYFESLEPKEMLAADAVYTVTTLNDVVDEFDGEVSLREALEHSAADGYGSGGYDTIQFAPELTGTILLGDEDGDGIVDSSPGQLEIDSNVKIEGLGEDKLSISALGSSNTRVFYVQTNAEAEINGLTIRDGNKNSHGGGIYTRGKLVLNHVSVVDNSTAGHGGGIFVLNGGSLEMNNSTIDNNHSDTSGGGIQGTFKDGVSLTINSSTISNNYTTGNGGGLNVKGVNGGYETFATITNSTISSNHSEGYAGGIRTQSDFILNIYNSTIYNNSSEIGLVGGLLAYDGTSTTLHNTIIAGSKIKTSPTDEGIATYDAQASSGVDAFTATGSSNNFIGMGHSSIGITNGDVWNNQVGSSTDPLDPQLSDLGYYGGTTKTHALLTGSDAIDAGQNTLLAILSSDQRGSDSIIVNRFVGAAIDIGAFEYGAKPIEKGTPFLVNDDVGTGYQSVPWVSVNKAGDTVVTWHGYGPESSSSTDWGIYMQIVNPDGDHTSISRRVDNGVSSNTFYPPKATIDEAGNVAIIWQEGSTTSKKLWLRRYNKNGTPIDVLPIDVSTDAISNIENASIASNASGQILLTWLDNTGTLYFRRFSMGSFAYDAEPRVIATSSAGIAIKTASSGRYAFLSDDGEFSVAWTERGIDNIDHIKLQSFSSGGTVKGEVLAISSSDGDWVETPDFSTGPLITVSSPEKSSSLYDIVVDGDGNVSVAWLANSSWEVDVAGEAFLRDEGSLYISQISSEDQVINSFKVSSAPWLRDSSSSSYTLHDHYQLDRPGLAVDSFGRLGVAWGINQFWYFSNQSAWPTEIDIINAFALPDPIVENTPTNAGDIYVQWFNQDGTPYPEDALKINQFGTSRPIASYPSLATDGTGGFLLTGVALNLDPANYRNDDIYGQRFTLDTPIRMDNEGTLTIHDIYSEYDHISISTNFVAGKRVVQFNDIVTNYLVEDVTRIVVKASGAGNTIDLSRVDANIFSNLTLGIEIYGGAGDDVIFGSQLVDTIHGEDGKDRIFGGEGGDFIHGGDGKDTLSGQIGDDFIYGDSGDDILYGLEGDDELYGGLGNDKLDGGTGSTDRLDGGDDNDVYLLTENHSLQTSIFDSDGVDTVDLSNATIAATLTLSGTGVVFSLTGGDRQLTIDGTSTIENAIGTPENDTITGTIEGNTLEGGAGKDVLIGLGGNDVLKGGTGNDIYDFAGVTSGDIELSDSLGEDKIDFSNWTHGVTIDLSQYRSADAYQTIYTGVSPGTVIRLKNIGLQDIENIIGTDYADTLIGHEGDNELFGGRESDIIDGQGGNDILLGEDAFDDLEVADNADGTSNYSELGTGWSDNYFGFNRSQRSASAGSSNSATWNFTNLESGEYEVYVTWSIDSDAPEVGASNAIYKVTTFGPTITADAIDQSIAPSDEYSGGTFWQQLKDATNNLFTVDHSGILSVELSDTSSGGMVYADAVRIAKHNVAPTIDSISGLEADGETWDIDTNSTIRVTASDPDGNDADLEIIDALGTDNITIADVSAGVWDVTYSSSSEFQNSTFPILLEVSDSGSNSKSVDIRIDAVNGVANTAPDFSTTISDIDVDEGVAATFTFTITDADHGDEQLDFSFGPGTSRSVIDSAQITYQGQGATSHDHEYQFSWTPGEADQGEHNVVLRVTDQGNAPLRDSDSLVINVNEVNSAPEVVLGSLALVYNTGDNSGENGSIVTADATMTGQVTNDSGFGLVQIEVDYSYDGSTFEVDERVSVSTSDFDPSIGIFTITPNANRLNLGSSHDFAVRAREWDGEDLLVNDGFLIGSTIDELSFTPNPDVHDSPVLIIELKNDTGTADDQSTIDPTILGKITNDGPVENMTVRLYTTSTSSWDSALATEIVRVVTDEYGEFEFTPSDFSTGTNYVWGIAEEVVQLGSITNPTLSNESPLTIELVQNTAPTIDQIYLALNSGSQTDTITTHPEIQGIISDGAHGNINDVAIEFSYDLDFSTVLGTSTTNESGEFFFSPYDLPVNTEETVYARALEWDDQTSTLLEGSPNNILITFSPNGSSEVADVVEFTLKYEDDNGQVIDPSVQGLVTKNGIPIQDILVEIFIKETNEVEFLNPDGVAVTDEKGRFEYTPVGLELDATYDIVARAVELIYETASFDSSILQEGEEFHLRDESDQELDITIVDQAIPEDPFIDFVLAYDTGTLDDDFQTADPTVKGQVDYRGDMSNVRVELIVDNGGILTEGEATPDENGYFEFIPTGLSANDEYHIQARVVVPNFGARLPEYESTNLDENWYSNEFDFSADTTTNTNPWADSNNDGIPDSNQSWLDDLFTSEDATPGGQWYESSFERDWGTILADLTSEWQTLDNLDSELLITYDPSENNDPTITLEALSAATHKNPSVSGALDDDGQVNGVELHFYVVLPNGGGRELDGSAYTDSNGEFDYTFTKHFLNDSTDFEIDVVEPVYEASTRTVTNVASGTISTLVRDDLKVSALRLKNGTIGASGLSAIDPTVIGYAESNDSVSYQTIQFDYNNDGIADASVETDNLGEFEFTPTGISGDIVSDAFTLRARLVEEFDGDKPYSEFGAWSTPLSWEVVANNTPVLEIFELAYDTGHPGLSYSVQDQVTSDPTLIGRVSDDFSNSYLTVEFRHQAYPDDAIVDASVVTDADGSFTYKPTGLTPGYWDIQARVVEFDPVNDAANSTGWQSITVSGDPTSAVENSGSTSPFNGFLLIEPTAAFITTLNHSGSIYNPTFTGTVDDVDTPENVTVDFYLGTTVDHAKYLGSTEAEKDGTFTFVPTGLEFGTDLQIHAVASEINYITGERLTGTGINTSLFDFDPISTDPSYGNYDFQVNVFDELSSTSLVEIALEGYVVYDEDNYSTEYAEVAIFESGNLDISSVTVVSIDSDGGFLFSPELASSTESVKFRARAIGVDSNGLVFSNWTSDLSVIHNLELPSIATTGSNAWKLEGDIGSGGEKESYTSTISGVAESTADLNGAEIEFDFDGNGVADDLIYTEEDGSFTYEFTDLTPGDITVQVRAVRYHTYDEDNAPVPAPAISLAINEDIEISERIEGDWQTLDFTLLNSAPTLDQIQLTSDPTPDSGVNPSSTDPTIRGQVTSPIANSVSGMTVEIDYQGDGVADTTTVVVQSSDSSSATGNFEITLSDLTRQDGITIFLRAVDNFSGTEAYSSEWKSFVFDLLPLTLPTVDEINLEFNEDLSGTGAASSQPAISGTTTSPDGANHVWIEFDYKAQGSDFDGYSDGSANVDLYGNYSYSPDNLPLGDVEIRARVIAVVGTETLIGAWSDQYDIPSILQFAHKTSEQVVMSDLSIENYNLGIISGRATINGYGSSARVQIGVSTSSTPIPNGNVTSNSYGFFRYELKELTAGNTYSVYARSATIDPVTGNSIYGEWQEFNQELNYQPAPVSLPTLTEFQLAYDPIIDVYGNATSDPTVKGEVSGIVPQLYIELSYNGSDTTDATIPVLADGTFQHTPTGWNDGATYSIKARTKSWDPYYTGGGQYVYSESDWSTIPSSNVATFTLDQTVNTAATVLELEFVQDASAGASTPQSSAPRFKGSVQNDGRLGGLIVEFDHNQDGIIDGRTTTRSDGSFYYEAAGLEPSAAIQKISARVHEKDYWGNEITGASLTYDFILTSAPLVTNLVYATATQSVVGSVLTGASFASVDIEYVLLGEDSIPDLPNNLGEYTPDSIATTNLDTSGEFTISTAHLSSGPAAIVARAVDNSVTDSPVSGIWQLLAFTAGDVSSAALTINNFELKNNTGSLDDDAISSDPTVTGQIGTSGDGAYGVVEILVYDDAIPTNNLIATHRTNANSTGEFVFTPPNLQVGQNYSIIARTVEFDSNTEQEVFGTNSNTIALTLVANSLATILNFDRVSNPAPDDPTVVGQVENQDGGVAGLRIEFDHNNDNTTDGYAITNGNGEFTYLPLNIPAGNIVIRARVFEWDPVALEFSAPEWDATSGIASTPQYSLTNPGPTEPAISYQLDDSLSAYEIYSNALNEVLAGFLVEESLEGATSSNSIELGIGSMKLLHKGGSDQLDPEDQNLGQILTIDGGSLTIADPGTQISIGSFVDLTIGTYGTFSNTYTYDYSLQQLTTAKSINGIDHLYQTQTELKIYGSYSYNDGETSIEFANPVSNLSPIYTFTFNAYLATDTNGNLTSVAYEQSERVNTEFFVGETLSVDGNNPYDTSSATSYGIHSFVYTEGDENEAQYSLATPSSSVQDFALTETIHVETWLNEEDTDIEDVTNRTATTFLSIDAYSIYDERTTGIGEISYSSGSQTLTGDLIVDSSGTLNSTITETETYLNRFADSDLNDVYLENYESGTDITIGNLFYDGQQHSEISYATNGPTTSNFNYQETLITTTNLTGSGNSAYSTNVEDVNEEAEQFWNYELNSTEISESYSSGRIELSLIEGKTVRKLDATLQTESSIESDSLINSSIDYSSTSLDATNEGHAESTLENEVFGEFSSHEFVHRIDDKYQSDGAGKAEVTVIAKERREGYGSATITDPEESTTTVLDYSSRSEIHAEAKAITNHEFTLTEEGDQSEGNYQLALNTHALAGAQSVGTVIDSEGLATPVRDSEVAEYHLEVSSNNIFNVDQLDTSSSPIGTYSIEGEVDRKELTKVKTSSFVGIGGEIEGLPAAGSPGRKYYDTSTTTPLDSFTVLPSSLNFSLQQSESTNISHEEYGYLDSNGTLTSRGQFKSDEKNRTQVITQIKYQDDVHDYFSRDVVSFTSTDETDGIFSDTPDGRTADATSTEVDEAFIDRRQRYNTSYTNEDGSERSQYGSNSEFRSYSRVDSESIISVDNDQVTIDTQEESPIECWVNSHTGVQTLDDQRIETEIDNGDPSIDQKKVERKRSTSRVEALGNIRAEGTVVTATTSSESAEGPTAASFRYDLDSVERSNIAATSNFVDSNTTYYSQTVDGAAIHHFVTDHISGDFKRNTLGKSTALGAVTVNGENTSSSFDVNAAVNSTSYGVINERNPRILSDESSSSIANTQYRSENGYKLNGNVSSAGGEGSKIIGNLELTSDPQVVVNANAYSHRGENSWSRVSTASSANSNFFVNLILIPPVDKDPLDNDDDDTPIGVNDSSGDHDIKIGNGFIGIRGVNGGSVSITNSAIASSASENGTKSPSGSGTYTRNVNTSGGEVSNNSSISGPFNALIRTTNTTSDSWSQHSVEQRSSSVKANYFSNRTSLIQSKTSGGNATHSERNTLEVKNQKNQTANHGKFIDSYERNDSTEYKNTGEKESLEIKNLSKSSINNNYLLNNSNGFIDFSVTDLSVSSGEETEYPGDTSTGASIYWPSGPIEANKETEATIKSTYFGSHDLDDDGRAKNGKFNSTYKSTNSDTTTGYRDHKTIETLFDPPYLLYHEIVFKSNNSSNSNTINEEGNYQDIETANGGTKRESSGKYDTNAEDNDTWLAARYYDNNHTELGFETEFLYHHTNDSEKTEGNYGPTGGTEKKTADSIATDSIYIYHIDNTEFSGYGRVADEVFSQYSAKKLNSDSSKIATFDETIDYEDPSIDNTSRSFVQDKSPTTPPIQNTSSDIGGGGLLKFLRTASDAQLLGFLDGLGQDEYERLTNPDFYGQQGALGDYELTDEEEKLLADRINGRYTAKQDDPLASVGGAFAEGLWEGAKDIATSEIPGIAQGRAGYEIWTGQDLITASSFLAGTVLCGRLISYLI